VKEISSTSNPYIKKIIAWQEKSKLRKADNVFVIDGWKETKMALAWFWNINDKQTIKS